MMNVKNVFFLRWSSREIVVKITVGKIANLCDIMLVQIHLKDI